MNPKPPMMHTFGLLAKMLLIHRSIIYGQYMFKYGAIPQLHLIYFLEPVLACDYV